VVGVGLNECVPHCQAADHERLGHEHFLDVTRNLYLTSEEQQVMLHGWERAWSERRQAVDNLLAAIQEAVNSLDATVDYQGNEGWKVSFLDRHGLKLDDRKVVLKEE
jgi:hypothetical protein